MRCRWYVQEPGLGNCVGSKTALCLCDPSGSLGSELVRFSGYVWLTSLCNNGIVTSSLDVTLLLRAGNAESRKVVDAQFGLGRCKVPR